MWRNDLNELEKYLGSASCNYPKVKTVTPKILSPREGAITSPGVTAHLIGTRPLFCDFTHFITVDGVPYEQVGTAGHGAAVTSRNLLTMSRRPNASRRRWSRYCISTIFAYLRFHLEPGPHTLRVHSNCPQGTEVPPTIGASVEFAVRR